MKQETLLEEDIMKYCMDHIAPWGIKNLNQASKITDSVAFKIIGFGLLENS
jgi:hypothetical protein